MALFCCATAADRSRDRGARRSRASARSRSRSCRAASMRSSARPTTSWCSSCSCRPTSGCSTAPASTSSSSCKDGERRSYSMANAPHTDEGPIELHIRHMPGGKFTDHVFGAMKEHDILRFEGPLGTLLPARGFRQADRAARLGHRLRADQGDRRARVLQECSERPMTLYWGAPPQAGPVPARAVPRSWARDACRTSATCRCCRSRRRATTGPAAPASSTAR